MKHANISFFIPHLGCPHKCTFCNQRSISGSPSSVSPDEVKTIASREAKRMTEEQRKNTEIAFFGGSFTAIPRDLMTEYLSAAYGVVSKYGLYGIRISTRPDCISDDVLDILGEFGVRDIELGAQSTDDRVLELNGRGHSAEDIFKASEMIKARGFSLGLQIMPGLYGDTDKTIKKTVEDVIKIKPATVRVYPTVVVKNTELHRLYEEGKFIPLSTGHASEICARMIIEFRENGIEIIKMGLHSETTLQRDVIAGPFHPAFKELCENRIFYDIIKNKLSDRDCKRAVVFVHPKSLSKALGMGKANKRKLYEEGYDVVFMTDDSLGKYEIKIGRI